MSIVLSQIWGQGERNQICKKYILEYIEIIEEIVKNGIEKNEIIQGDSNIIASRYFWICMFYINI